MIRYSRFILVLARAISAPVYAQQQSMYYEWVKDFEIGYITSNFPGNSFAFAVNSQGEQFTAKLDPDFIGAGYAEEGPIILEKRLSDGNIS